MKQNTVGCERLSDLIETALADGEAAHDWAERCGWVPGSGRCRHQATLECGTACLFHAARAKEARAILQRRRHRRPLPSSR
jgi:hypothetical protein